MIKYFKLSLFLLIVIFSLITAQTSDIKLNGEIVAFEENNKTQVSIVVYVDSLDELESYLIKNVGKGAELKNKNGQQIDLTGTVTTNEEGENCVTVSSYKIITMQNVEDDFSFDENDTLDESATKNQWEDY